MENPSAPPDPGNAPPPPPAWLSRLWAKRKVALATAGSVATFVGFGGLTWAVEQLHAGDRSFAATLLATQGKLEDPAASEMARSLAAGELQRLPRNPRQAGRVAEVLHAFLEAGTRPAVAADPEEEGEPCAQPADSASPGGGGAPVAPYFGRALVALGEAVRRAEGGRVVRLAGADLRGVAADSVWLEGASLAGACLSRARLGRARLAGADLSGASLREARLEDAALDSARLDDASLVRAELNKARLSRARLIRADLSGASLVGTDLTLALLADATLAGVDLSGASLAGAYLAGADLSGVLHWDEVCDFEGAYLSGAQGLPPDLLRLAVARGAVAREMTQQEWQAKRREMERLRPRGEPGPRCRSSGAAPRPGG